jgi:hypothetical protein
MDTVAIFCALDDFCQWFEPWCEQRLVELVPKRRRRRGAGWCPSEVMTIRVGFHLSGYRTLKDYYRGSGVEVSAALFSRVSELQPVG